MPGAVTQRFPAPSRQLAVADQDVSSVSLRLRVRAPPLRLRVERPVLLPDRALPFALFARVLRVRPPEAAPVRRLAAAFRCGNSSTEITPCTASKASRRVRASSSSITPARRPSSTRCGMRAGSTLCPRPLASFASSGSAASA